MEILAKSVAKINPAAHSVTFVREVLFLTLAMTRRATYTWIRRFGSGYRETYRHRAAVRVSN